MSSELTELPEGWANTNLGELGEWSSGGTPSRTHPEYYQGDIPWVKTGNLPDTLITEIDESITLEGLTNSSAKLFPSGSLIVAMYGATIGKLGILKEPAATNQACAALLSKGITAEIIPYLFYYLLRIREDLKRIGQGGAQPNISQTILKDYTCPLPPLNEQRRIVAKIEALRARSQRVKEVLEAIPPLLDQFRQSVLAAAFRGDLTADWREKNPDVEPASVLLERIRAERDKRYEQGCKKAVVEARKKPILFKENLEPVELSNLPIIPDTGCWERLVNISNIVGGVTKGRKFGNRKTIMLPYLRVANVQDGFLDLDEIKEIETLPEDLEKYHLEYGDILFTEGGDRDKLGRGTVWRNNIEKCVHQNHVYRARLYYLGVSCEYISLATKSEYAKAYFFANASQTVNLASINITSLGNLPLPMPVEEEQKEIVYRVQTLFKFADQIAQQYQEVKVQLDQLDQSILAKAFRGELVSQDLNDEPASLLLGCIRSERNKLEAYTKTAKKSTGNTGGRRSRKAKQDAKSVQLELPILE